MIPPISKMDGNLSRLVRVVRTYAICFRDCMQAQPIKCSRASSSYPTGKMRALGPVIKQYREGYGAERVEIFEGAQSGAQLAEEI
jgi:hypothetical protein